MEGERLVRGRYADGGRTFGAWWIRTQLEGERMNSLYQRSHITF